MKRIAIALAAAACLVGTRAAAREQFTYEQLMRGTFAQRGVSGIRSMNDGEHFTVSKGGRIEKYAYADGQMKEVLFDTKEQKQFGSFSDYQFSPSENKIILTTGRKGIYRRSYTADHYIWDRGERSLKAVTPQGDEQVATLSPDESRVAFVRDNDIWLAEPGTGNIVRVTDDGRKNHIINGHTDWVYEEEFAFTKAYEFSPDGRRIAYLKFDESRVPEYSMTVYGHGLYPSQYVYKYPKAGEPNSVVSLWVYDIESGVNTRIDTGSDSLQYIPLIGWTPAGELYFCLENRLQNSYRLIVQGEDGSQRTVYSESDPKYIEQVNRGTITFLPNGRRFIVKNETSGWAHLYLYDMEKGLLNPITQGEWEVSGIVSIAGDKLYYMSNEGSPLRNNLYEIKLNGRGKRRLTTDRGNYSIAPSRGMKYYISTFSNVTTPRTVTLHKGNGQVVRVLENNDALKARLDTMHLPVKEFFRMVTERGDTLNGYLIKPADFRADGKYPVFMTQYSGPGSQSVKDSWGMDWQDALVQKGYVVACVDGRGTGGRGAAFRKCTYADLGAKEVEDQISAARWLASRPWADPQRIGIYGWSYGGFMALNCILKGNDVFSMAIAVAPVTSWRFYDTIYTEIYNGMPQDNPEGYDSNSPINYADRLRGKLLIMHGSGDDNVHVQNTMRMVDALVRAGKSFDMMIYPDDNHSMYPTGRSHVTRKMFDYTLENL